ncbi:hypothetical protein MesoLjLc_37080 [Mesorhizobium sp. L-8-10]|uniref:hypothetical protein n=1 Tax=unclassified Mesorhizobium TaxID=325217 RepID=UPI0019262C70|nr:MULTISPECIES: hypothetical protein [unclassified Mesorhizobium]BCH24041.1 hypothetical protein MesoLjLb_38260 [Mesorhizobium sp. L-8-3]BCH31778.1 hypothetical protein MesoLjLc_37080 [Mesorhizobium sp. L-8-10]
MRAAAFAAIAAACLNAGIVAASVAQGLDIAKMPYGNENGCKVGRGEQVDTDDFLLLRPDGIDAYASSCEFVQSLPAKDGSRVLTGLCDEEGHEGKVVRMLSVGPSADDPSALTISDGNGGLWGEVKPCS